MPDNNIKILSASIILSVSIILSSIIIYIGLINSYPKYQAIESGNSYLTPAKIVNTDTGEVFTHINGGRWLNKKSPK